MEKCWPFLSFIGLFAVGFLGCVVYYNPEVRKQMVQYFDLNSELKKKS
jgi:hypothetical protein